MRQRLVSWVLCAVLLLSAGIAAAQNGTTDDTVQITFPPVVSVLSGSVDILGTANAPDQSGYFLQYRALDDDLNPVGGENALFSPVSVQQRTPVVDDVLSVWDTTTVEDGIYELQLVVNRNTGEPLRDTVAAVRVANQDALAGTATAPPILRATPTRTLVPTATPAPNPTVTATIEANVRMGDSTLYPVVGFLLLGESAPVIGRSSRSGWLYIRLDDGEEGFISPSVVSVSGDLTGVQLVTPPPVPATPTPTPTNTPIATNTPVTSPNLIVDGFRLDPSSPVCNETFTIIITVENVGNGESNNSATIDVNNRHIDSGQITEGTIGAIPPLPVDGQFTARIPITVDTFEGETQRLEIRLDSTNNVPESNESDNFFTFDYTLQESDSCG